MLACRSSSRSAPTLNPHSTRCQPVPNFPRLRALALFGRRPPQRVDSLLMPASENLHNNQLMRYSKHRLSDCEIMGGVTALKRNYEPTWTS